jgi:hypothetical protein
MIPAAEASTSVKALSTSLKTPSAVKALVAVTKIILPTMITVFLNHDARPSKDVPPRQNLG